MAKIYTYIPPVKKVAGGVSPDCATKQDVRDGVQEAKNYTDQVVNDINANGGSGHVHVNKVDVLDKLTVVDGELCFNGFNLSGVVYADVEG